MRPGLLVKVLPREPEVHGDGGLALEQARRPEGFTGCLPACAALLRRRQLRRAQVIRVQIVPVRVVVREATVRCMGLPRA